MPITLTFHIRGYVVTIKIKGENRHSEPHPVKRTEKNYIIFPTGSLGCQSLFYAAR